MYASRVLEVEQGCFTPLVFTTIGWMANECTRYHSRLAELLPTKKGEDYSTTMSWVRDKVSFALLRSALLCLRGSRCTRRAIQRLNNPGQEINGEVLTPCTNSSSRCSARHSLSFRSGKALSFLTLGFDAQMQSLIKAWHHKANLPPSWGLEEENVC